uniref:Arcadin 1 domain-containing protein n=1 Tax=viral metagenome TaxID=1070528 RepID=A0A6M3IDQ2_9ZZZZ
MKKYKVQGVEEQSLDSIVMSLVIHLPLPDVSSIIERTQGTFLDKAFDASLKKLMKSSDLMKLVTKTEPFVTKIELTTEEYEQLGTPTVGDLVMIEITKTARES